MMANVINVLRESAPLVRSYLCISRRWHRRPFEDDWLESMKSEYS